ncbi:hypothetical protein, partial [Ruminococcus sp. RTP21484sp1]|uniref:hypothetical protein n=1 Tax=Ruminococcus sp. RTP21484sp1 TaxID=3151395 RepID=UPI00321BE0B1
VDGSIILHWDIFLYGILGHYHKWFIGENEMKFFVVFFGKTCYIKNNGFIMLSQRWTICDVVFGSLNLKMYLKNDFSNRFWNRADATDRI